MNDENKKINENDVMRTGDRIRFATDILRKQTDLGRQIEVRANFTLGLSGAILTFALNSMRAGYSPELIIIAGGSILAIILCLLALKPPKFFSKKQQEQSIFYHTAIATKTSGEYIDNLIETSNNLNKTLGQYGLEIYNITKYSILYKKKFAHLAIKVLTLGFVASILFAPLKYYFLN